MSDKLKPKPIFSICSHLTGEVLHQFNSEADACCSLPFAWHKKSIGIYKFTPKLVIGAGRTPCKTRS